MTQVQQTVGGKIVNIPASVTRPADTTAYAANDLVANSATAGSVVPLSWSVGRYSGGSVCIRRGKLSKTATSTTNASFRLHLYTSSPTVTNGDNGVWVSTESGYLGAIDITVDRAFSASAAGIGVPVAGSEINAVLTGTTLYGLLEARGAYTPASGEMFTVTLELWQN